MNGLQQFSLGSTITGSPHSVCVSLPTMADVIGYEEKEPRVMHALQTGYPRFFEHPLLQELRETLREAQGLDERPLVLVEGASGLQQMCAFAGEAGDPIAPLDSVHGAQFSEPGAAERARRFLQHTGLAPSSRQAEDLLVAQGRRAGPETLGDLDGDGAAGAALAEFLGVPDLSAVHLCRSGMNAFYAVFRSLQRAMPPARRRWIRLGWLYVDTVRILEAWNEEGEDALVWHDVADLDGFAEHFAPIAAEVAGIVTEAPTNPLIQTTDLEHLRRIADRWGCALVIDPTIASAAAMDLHAAADVTVTSLTKYAAPAADVMMGAVIPNPGSRWGPVAAAGLEPWLSAPYARDRDRLAAQVPGAIRQLDAVRASMPEVVAALEAHPAVERVWWSGADPASRRHFARWCRSGPNAPAAVCSFTVRGDFSRFYDRLQMAKSPSFGASFSMLCPFLYLAHYREVCSSAGRRRMTAAGLHPELMRLSLGTEPVEAVIAALRDALAEN